MNPERMAARGLDVTHALAGTLRGVRLAFNKKASDAPHRSYANVMYCPDSLVEGVLYGLSGPDEIFKMDPFEGTPRLYSRDLFPIETAEGVIYAWVYVANKAMHDDSLKPEQLYLDHLLAGKPYLTESYYASLLTVECIEGGEPRW